MLKTHNLQNYIFIDSQVHFDFEYLQTNKTEDLACGHAQHAAYLMIR